MDFASQSNCFVLSFFSSFHLSTFDFFIFVFTSSFTLYVSEAMYNRLGYTLHFSSVVVILWSATGVHLLCFALLCYGYRKVCSLSVALYALIKPLQTAMTALLDADCRRSSDCKPSSCPRISHQNTARCLGSNMPPMGAVTLQKIRVWHFRRTVSPRAKTK